MVAFSRGILETLLFLLGRACAGAGDGIWHWQLKQQNPTTAFNNRSCLVRRPAHLHAGENTTLKCGYLYN